MTQKDFRIILILNVEKCIDHEKGWQAQKKGAGFYQWGITEIVS